MYVYLKDLSHGYSYITKLQYITCLIDKLYVFFSVADAVEYPVFTFSSGPTNSMRGAMFLSGKKNGIVVDIGGTSTDVGILVNGFPREASSQVKVLSIH